MHILGSHNNFPSKLKKYVHTRCEAYECNKLPLSLPPWVIVNNCSYFSALKLNYMQIHLIVCNVIFSLKWILTGLWGYEELERWIRVQQHFYFGWPVFWSQYPHGRAKMFINSVGGFLFSYQSSMVSRHTCRTHMKIIHTYQKGKSKTNVNERVYSMGLIRFSWSFSLKICHCSLSPEISKLWVFF